MMTPRNSIAALKEEITAERRTLHENPQTAYEETFAAELIAKKLDEWGVKYEAGWAGGTGIVATIEGENTSSGRAIALRADIDALDVIEKSGQPWASKTAGKMHACGHDGHTAMLLGAAKYLQETRNFNGTVHLVFQPAEEGGKGADRMIEEGLFKKYPVEGVYGLHNWPGLPRGEFATNPGPIMAAVDSFDITITGKGAHAAMPNQGIDPAVITAQLIMALQTLVSRESDPVDAAVVSVTNVQIGTGAFNVIGDTAKLTGSVRSFKPETRDMLERRIEELSHHICLGFGATVEVDYMRGSDATINTPGEAAFCVEVANDLFGPDKTHGDIDPCMGAEDFGAMLMEVPGCYVWLGQGEPDQPDSPHNNGLHHPAYDFNDEIIPIGIEFWVSLVEKKLAA